MGERTFSWVFQTALRLQPLTKLPVRANTLSDRSVSRAYLSGLLIGTEIHNAAYSRRSNCTIVGSKRLMALYELALSSSHPDMNYFFCR